jgi:hypothetical protein
MEVEQRVIIKFLRFKEMKLRDIHHQFTLAFGEEAYTLASLKRWMHELKTGRTILTDDTRSGRLSIDHIDVLIRKHFSETPFASVRSLTEYLTIPKTTVWRRLTESFQFKSWHFKSVPYMLTKELGRKRVDGARTLLDALEAEQRIEFRDIVTGDESWIYLQMSPNSIWIGAEEIAPTRPRTTIASTKTMLAVFWGIRGVRPVNWLPLDASFNKAHSNQHILQVMASELHAGEETKHYPWPLLHMNNARPHRSKRNFARMEELRLKRVLHPSSSLDILPSKFFLFGWLKGELSS